MILASLVLLAYYPSVLAGFSSIDDSTLYKFLEHMDGWSLRGLFIPSVSGGGYYRPFIGLSYFFDKYILGLYPGLMHIENILLHLMNAVLVYFLALHITRTISPDKSNNSLLPLAAAILFGLHPINSESVNWISGRTDLLAGFFVLSSALLLLNFRESRWKGHIVLSMVAFFCGVISKESAAAFLPGYLLLMNAGHKTFNGTVLLGKHSYRQHPAVNITVYLSAFIVLLAFFFLRSAAFTSNSNRIGMTISSISSDWLHSMFVVLRAFGFYMKKLIMPGPLNLAIMEVDPLYEILAVPLVALCGYIAIQRTTISALFMTGILLTLPAYLIVFGQIAWTPYAERYLYISSAFIVIAAVIYFGSILMSRSVRGTTVACSIVIGIVFAMTLSRSMVWKDDFLLVKDTVDKSPRSRDMRVVYASMLIGRGEYDEALEQLREGSAMPLIGVYDERYDTNRAFIMAKQGRIDESIDLYNHVLEKTNKQSVNALQELASLYEFKRDESSDKFERQAFGDKVLSYNTDLYNLTHDPYLLYKVGNDALSLGHNQKAIKYYQQAFDNMHPDEPYRAIVIKRISRLVANAKHEHSKNNK